MNASGSKQSAVLYVGGSAASDRNPGTALRPLRTIAAALTLADQDNIKNIDCKVFIRNGTYRERMDLLPIAGLTLASITIEAEEAGQAIISGSDVWSDWRPSTRKNVYIHGWPFTWGLVPYPMGWGGQVVVPDLLRRRELIALNGLLLRQVLTESTLTPGSFLISEAAKTIEMYLPNGVALQQASIEVGVRSNLLYIEGRHNLQIKGLIFQHDSSGIDQGSALSIVNSEDVVLSDCQLNQNGISGLRLIASRGVQISNTVANENGLQGMAAWQLGDSSFVNTETSDNNWRGSAAGFLEWAAGGAKLMLLRNVTIRNHKALRNKTFGIWLDTDCKNTVIQDSFFGNNLRDGIFLEANEGPLSLTGNQIWNNRNGILIATSQNAAFVNNDVFNNSQAEIMISGQPGGEEIHDWETGLIIHVLARNIRVSGNGFSSQNAGGFVLTTLPNSDWLSFISSSVFDSNTYYNPRLGSRSFAGGSGTLLTFPQWQLAFRQDVNSSWSALDFQRLK